MEAEANIKLRGSAKQMEAFDLSTIVSLALEAGLNVEMTATTEKAKTTKATTKATTNGAALHKGPQKFKVDSYVETTSTRTEYGIDGAGIRGKVTEVFSSPRGWAYAFADAKGKTYKAPESILRRVRKP